MKETPNELEQIIKEEVKKEADDIKAAVQESEQEDLSEEKKDEIRQNLQKQIEEYQKEKIYEQLSQEDREALELGKQIQREQKTGGGRRKSRGKRLSRMGLNLAAVLALVLILGITSVGGPERIVEMVRTMVGDREVVKVNSNEDNLKIAEEKEEEAYQEIKDAFGVDPVKIIIRPNEMKFSRLEMDEIIQTAELFYQYKGENIVYFVNASYADASWGMDAEDEVTDTYYKERKGQRIEIKEYQIADTGGKRYSASFTYNGVEYFLIGAMSKNEFETIIDNLHFNL